LLCLGAVTTDAEHDFVNQVTWFRVLVYNTGAG